MGHDHGDGCGCEDGGHEHFNFRAVDSSTWDGPAAMSNCADAETPASCYRSICAGRRDGDPDLQSSWALPHHKTPGAAPNAAGVRNGLSRLSKTQGLANADAARAHLEAHLKEIQAAEGNSADGDVERRLFNHVVFEVRAEDGEVPMLTGHAAVFNQLSETLMFFRERIKPGAFADAIRAGGTYGLWNHNPDFPLANSDNGTLRLSEDDEGLQFRMELDPDVSYASDLLRNVRSGRVSKMSFGFTTDTDQWHEENGETVRDLIKVRRLYDVSPVVFPAYPQTQVSARARLMAEHLREHREAAAVEEEEEAPEGEAPPGDERAIAASLELRSRHVHLIELEV